MFPAQHSTWEQWGISKWCCVLNSSKQVRDPIQDYADRTLKMSILFGLEAALGLEFAQD